MFAEDATVRFNLALKVLIRDERYKRFTTAEHNARLVRLFDDLYVKHMAGEMDSWETAIEELLAE
jgi:hypothetical protein